MLAKWTRFLRPKAVGPVFSHSLKGPQSSILWDSSEWTEMDSMKSYKERYATIRNDYVRSLNSLWPQDPAVS